ncbi:MAG: aspartate-semialdehyde dehydrogenase [Gaiellales bacterium]
MARVAILGATGAVGRTMIEVLGERSLPIDELVLLASERSAGREIRFKGETLTVQAVTPEAFDGIDVAIFSAGATRSREWAPIAVERGATVVDNSSAFRMQPDVPLVVADVNPHVVHTHSGIIANPNCSTMQLMPVLRPVRDTVGIERITVATYQAVSGTGQSAIQALREESTEVLGGTMAPEARQYPKPIAFDVLPVAGSFSGDQGYTDEELKLVHESRKILELPDLRVSATCTRVPVFDGHSEAVWIETREPLSALAFRALLEAEAGITVLDDAASMTYPTTRQAYGRDGVLVGRIREDLGAPNGLACWVVADNLRKGAASNAVDIADLLLAST